MHAQGKREMVDNGGHMAQYIETLKLKQFHATMYLHRTSDNKLKGEAKNFQIPKINKIDIESRIKRLKKIIYNI